MNNNLQYITSLDIDYLSTLDYVDLRTLCQTNKYFSHICINNQLLRQILYDKTNIIFPKDYNISQLLKNLDNDILNLINKLYITYPRWVNKELFLIDFRKKIYHIVVNALVEYMDDYYDYEAHLFSYVDSRANLEDLSANLLIDDFRILHAFVATGLVEPNDVDISIYLPTEFMDYIIYGIVKLPLNHYYDMYQLISHLLFFK